ncbi:hypothetical protein [Bradyrhizobium liaoningense]|uniref:hypothetical protein n=1 Tax=Bradyrhizobium liaoningense TaxID=43992 RepID=UPI0012FDFC6A|nr:hypothetical protein [Bradyrhizobium liaoningense]
MSPETTARMIITAIVVLGFGGVLIAWIIFPPATHSDILSGLAGVLGSGYLLVLNHWFGKATENKS